jgi:hypothetical protein
MNIRQRFRMIAVLKRKHLFISLTRVFSPLWVSVFIIKGYTYSQLRTLGLEDFGDFSGQTFQFAEVSFGCCFAVGRRLRRVFPEVSIVQAVLRNQDFIPNKDFLFLQKPTLYYIKPCILCSSSVVPVK